MKVAFAAAFAGAALLASPASAATLIQYNFTGAPGDQVSTAATNVATGLTGLAFTRGAGLDPNAGSNSINSNDWTGQASDYLSFGFTVTTGFTASINQLLVGTRSSPTGPGLINLLVSIDGGAFTNLTSIVQPNGNGDVYTNLSFGPLTALSNVEFRLLAANGTAANGNGIGANGTFRVENYVSGGSNTPVSINGTLTGAAVPEPATWAMMIVGFALVAAGMRRRPAVRFHFA